MKQWVAMYCTWMACFFATGCSTDGWANHPDEGMEEEWVPVSFSLRQEPLMSIACVEGMTKAEPPVEEGTTKLAINDLTVLQFDWNGNTEGGNDGSTVKCVTSRYILSPEPEEGDIYSIGLRSQENEEQYIVFIANAGAKFQNYEGKTLGAFREETVELDQQTMSEDNMMMIAAVKASFTATGNTGDAVEVNLQRLVARISFTWKRGLTVTGTTFTPLAMKIGNVPNKLKYADGFIDATTEMDYPEKVAGNFKNYTSIVSELEEGYTWYIPLNRHKEKGTGKTAYEKDATHAPNDGVGCTYVELSGIYTTPNMPTQLASYRFYPGGNITDDYTIERNGDYAIHAVIKGVNSFDKRVSKRNFKEIEPANCFVVAPEADNELLFNPYQAPGTDVAGTGVVYQNQLIENRFSRIAGVKILWQTVEGLLQSVSLSQGMVSVVPNATGVSGNALIAVYDEAGTILWSWHIWVTPYVGVLDGSGTKGKIQQYAECFWMDRNLGALSTTKGEEGPRFYYQWGRKDPFYTGSGVIVSGGMEVSSADMGTALNIDQSVGNPTVFFLNQSTGLWHGGNALTTLWTESGNKTVFDPCPAGWRVPAKAVWDTFDWGNNFSWDVSSDLGATRDVDGGELPAWYPKSGRLDHASMKYDESYTSFWSASFGATMPSVFQFNKGMSSTTEASGAWGAAVRCVKQ